METLLQTPDWNWEQQESTMLGFFGPTTDEVQSIEEQDIWKRKLDGIRFVMVSM